MVVNILVKMWMKMKNQEESEIKDEVVAIDCSIIYVDNEATHANSSESDLDFIFSNMRHSHW